MVGGQFGYGTGKIQYKDQAKMFKGKGRQDDPLPDDHPSKLYANTRVERSHRGDLDITVYEAGKEYREIWDATGNHKIIYPDGCIARGDVGTSVSKKTQGEINTCQYSSDSATYNHSRRVVGNLDTQQGLVKGGGDHFETAGNKTEAVAGQKTSATMMASGRGEYHIGKKTMNAEGGIGMGVNKGSSMKVWQRMEPDGTYHLQVTPSGAEGGKMVMKVNPDGTILVTSEKTCTFDIQNDVTIKSGKTMTLDASQGMSIKTPTLNIKANIKHKGSMKTSGTHTDRRGKHER